MVFFRLPRYHLILNRTSQRFFSNLLRNTMENMLKPPEEVYLMQDLNKTAFEKIIKVPVLSLRDIKVSSVLPLIKKFLLKLENFKPVNHIEQDNVSCVYLNPELIQTWADLPLEIRNNLEDLKLSETHLKLQDLTLKYENFNAETILRAVLPKDKEGVSSFTKVGHIVHVNLREHLIPYKNLVGEVLFDKVKGCESVVNKVNMIDNTYRNFAMEVLKGENKMLTTVKENNCKFEFDFSIVYWNSRLCTEHERIVKLLNHKDVLFDVFAGVGPFSIPAAKKKCKVFANDLNPQSYKWLMHNRKLNKISDDCFTGFNLDGRDFILTVVRENLPKCVADSPVVITMNLPAMAVEFLDAFIGLFKGSTALPEENFKAIIVHVYCFAKGENPEQIARALIHENLRVKAVDIESKIMNIFRVRTVSSMKEMMRVTLSLDRDILEGEADNKRKIGEDIGTEADLKKMCCRGDDKDGQKQKEEQQCVQSGRSQKPENEGQSQNSKE